MTTLPPAFPKPKVGLLCTADAFYHDNFRMDVVGMVREDERRIVEALRPRVDLEYPGIVTNAEEARRAAAQFKAADIDLLLLCELVYTFDPPVLGVLDDLRHTPLAVLYQQGTETIPKHFPLETYVRSWGAVGTTQITGTLARRQPDRKWKLVVGHTGDPAVIDRLAGLARGAAALRSLRDARLSYLPGPCDGMTDVWADDHELMRRFGVDILRTPVATLERIAAAVPEAAVHEELKAMRSVLDLDPGLRADELPNEARVAVALRELAVKEKLDAIAILLWPEIGRRLLTFPYYGLSRLADLGYPYGEEGDMNAALGATLLSRIAAGPVQYLEFHQYDKETNVLLSGHNCHAPLSFANPKHRPKLKPMIYGDLFPLIGQHKLGASVEMTSRPGPVTILSVGVGRQGYHLRTAECDVLDESPRPLSMPHVFLRAPRPVFEFVEKALLLGGGHHWHMAYGRHAEAVEMAGLLAGLPVHRL